MLAWFVAVVAVAVVGSVFVGRQVLLADLDARIDSELRQEAEELRRLATGDDPETGQPFGSDVERIFDLYVIRNVAYPNERVFFYPEGSCSGDTRSSAARELHLRRRFGRLPRAAPGAGRAAGGRVRRRDLRRC